MMLVSRRRQGDLSRGTGPKGSGQAVESKTRPVPAMTRAQTQLFLDSNDLASCPKLRDRSVGSVWLRVYRCRSGSSSGSFTGSAAGCELPGEAIATCKLWPLVETHLGPGAGRRHAERRDR